LTLSHLQTHSGKVIKQVTCEQCVHAAAHATPAASTAAAEPHRPVASAVEPHVPTQKELLAASLFGDSSCRPARQRRHPAHHAAPVAHHAASAQPAPVATTAAAAQPAAADLLLALDSPGPAASAAPAVSSGQHWSSCPVLRSLLCIMKTCVLLSWLCYNEQVCVWSGAPVMLMVYQGHLSHIAYVLWARHIQAESSCCVVGMQILLQLLRVLLRLQQQQLQQQHQTWLI